MKQVNIEVQQLVQCPTLIYVMFVWSGLMGRFLSLFFLKIPVCAMQMVFMYEISTRLHRAKVSSVILCLWGQSPKLLNMQPPIF